MSVTFMLLLYKHFALQRYSYVFNSFHIFNITTISINIFDWDTDEHISSEAEGKSYTILLQAVVHKTGYNEVCLIT